MPRPVSKKVITRLVKLSEVCRTLSICKLTFHRKYASVFTDVRCPEDRRRSIERKVYEDELALMVEAGAGTRGIAAVLAFRSQMNRKG